MTWTYGVDLYGVDLYDVDLYGMDLYGVDLNRQYSDGFPTQIL